MRYRALVAYDGTDFAGWQTQAGRHRTVQETLDDVLSQILRQPIHVEGAGRTDAGVHARGQVIAFDAMGGFETLARLQNSINAVLPDDVAVRDLAEAAPDFDPRRQALRRAYRYQIWNDPTRSPTMRRFSWHVPTPLELDAIATAAACFLGEHDFASFQGADKIPRPSIRRVEHSSFVCDGELLTYEVEANAFARHMVRNFVGQLVEVGLGRCAPERVREILVACDRSCAAPPAPPQGLFLQWVHYE